MQGIYFSEKRMTALSGVYSTFYLKPKEDVFNELRKASLDLPLFLLLGDKHLDEEGICDNCTCENNSCCEIYDPIFLRELDSLASHKYPIDFYTELFFNPVEYNGIVKHFSSDKFRICYQKDRSPEYEEKCPKKIRWQC